MSNIIPMPDNSGFYSFAELTQKADDKIRENRTPMNRWLVALDRLGSAYAEKDWTTVVLWASDVIESDFFSLMDKVQQNSVMRRYNVARMELELSKANLAE